MNNSQKVQSHHFFFYCVPAWLPYLNLQSTPGVATYTVPRFDDGASPAIPIPTGFPIGNSNTSVAYVSGYVAIQICEKMHHVI